MGYYTAYNMAVKGCKGESDFNNVCSALAEKDLIGYAFETPAYEPDSEIQYFYSYDAVKWYEHKKDMKEISEKYPDLTFALNGYGDDPGDLWMTYFKAGQMEVCVAEIPKPKTIEW